MNKDFHMWPLALGLIAISTVLCAQAEPGVSGATPARPPVLSEHIHGEIARLVRRDAGFIATPGKREVQAPPKLDEDEVLILSPMTVTKKAPPNLAPPRETPAEAFFRTGTIAEHVGKKVTTRFWFSSAQGLMLSFNF
jgi:hypothetical protein